MLLTATLLSQWILAVATVRKAVSEHDVVRVGLLQVGVKLIVHLSIQIQIIINCDRVH